MVYMYPCLAVLHRAPHRGRDQACDPGLCPECPAVDVVEVVKATQCLYADGPAVPGASAMVEGPLDDPVAGDRGAMEFDFHAAAAAVAAVGFAREVSLRHGFYPGHSRCPNR